MTRKRRRCTITLSPTAIQLLNNVGNSSAYIDGLILQHGREWTEALAVLLEHGWQPPELLAACEALEGYALANVSRSGPFLADELERKKAMATFGAHGVTPRARQARLKQLRSLPIVAHALATVAKEYALDNEACELALTGRGDAQ